MHRFVSRLSLAIVLALPMLAAALPSYAQGGVTLVIGRITDSPDKHEKRLTAMAEYLATELADYGVSNIDILITANEDEMATALRRGRVDILSETPFMALQLQAEGVVDILMREWKKGVPEYHSVIFVHKDAAISSIEDLAGRRIAFEDEGSTSGYMLPRNAIELAGLALTRLAKPVDPVPAGRVGFAFTGSETKVAQWVNQGIADAGALSNLDWADEETVPAEIKANLQVVYETRPVIRSTLMVNASLPAEVKERIAEILEHMHETEEGRKVMKTYSKVKRYDRIEVDALQGLEEAHRIMMRMRNRAS